MFQSPLQVLCHKLKRLRGAIQAWNKEVFGDIFQVVTQKEAEVWLAEIRMESDESEEPRVNLHLAQAQLRVPLWVEELFWKQKAHVKWLKEGERNTKFFYSVVKHRRVQSVIHKIKNERGEWVESEEEIGAEAVRFFEKLFTAQHPTSSPGLLQNILKILTDEDNVLLKQVPAKEEICRVMFEMDGESTPGPTGYTGKFFTAAWSIIGEDVVRAVCSFFCGAELPRAVTATSIVLIPKIAHP
ncbi:uncharacterized protein LOC113751977 [Coffea eugenioides]|uniref:Uncharacterized protein n=1 Tax=Coffea arabica TaxID=13443 RepID=A0A6P6V868_COFAR|nr:uncharacterized protein LOC113718159 [Coffea arabica]XP_027151922.1 uncharacterized protein LOC113751977 [Coffea eugenioides]